MRSDVEAGNRDLTKADTTSARGYARAPSKPEISTGHHSLA